MAGKGRWVLAINRIGMSETSIEAIRLGEARYRAAADAEAAAIFEGLDRQTPDHAGAPISPHCLLAVVGQTLFYRGMQQREKMINSSSAE